MTINNKYGTGFFSSFYLGRTNHCTIMHIASLEAHTTLNTYNLPKLALRGHLSTDSRTRGRIRKFLLTRTMPQPLGHSSTWYRSKNLCLNFVFFSTKKREIKVVFYLINYKKKSLIATFELK